MKLRKINPCPFCNCEAKAGVCSALSYHVQCTNGQCLAQIVVNIPDTFPKGYDISNIHEWCIGKAVKSWNKRLKTRK